MNPDIQAAREAIERLIEERKATERRVSQVHEEHLQGNIDYSAVRHVHNALQAAVYRADGAAQVWRALTGEEWQEVP
jgi:uncharacterized protein (UPF0335 family)